MSFYIRYSCPETEELAGEILGLIETWICDKGKSTAFIEFSSVQLKASALAELCWTDAENLTAAEA